MPWLSGAGVGAALLHLCFKPHMRIPAFTTRLSTGDSLEVRSPVGSDAAAMLVYVRELSREAWRALAHPPEVFAAMSDADERSFLEGVAAQPRSFFLAAFCAGRVIGTTNLRVDAATFSQHCGELGLGVLADYRRRGVARLLMASLIQVATELGVWNLTLRVRTFNEPAIALYESLDFRRVGTLRGVTALPEGYVDEYLYQRVVDRPA